MTRRLKTMFGGTRAGARRPAVLHVWLETLLVTALALGIGWLMRPGDPFFLQGFPWVVLAPLILGLQNGLRHALLSGLVLVLGAACSWRFGGAAGDAFPAVYPIVIVLVAVLTGVCRDRWRRSLEDCERENRKCESGLGRLTRAYHLLKRSHDDLEQRVATSGPGPCVIYDGVQARLQRSGAETLAEAGRCLVESFGHYGQVRAASVHAVRPAGARDAGARVDHIGSSRVVAEPVAIHGVAPPIDVDHPMVRGAVAARRVTSVREYPTATDPSAGLVCVPLADSNGRVWGVVLVHELPFTAMRDDHLTRLGVIGGCVGDWLAERHQGPGRVELAARGA